MTRSSRSSRALAATSVSALALLALTACGGADSKDVSGDVAAQAPVAGAAQVAVTMSSGADGDECTVDTTSVPAGPVTFTVKNEGATGINEFEVMAADQDDQDDQDGKVLGEKENVVPGLAAATLTLTLDGGTYRLYCPGATTEKTDLEVTGTADASGPAAGSTAALLHRGAEKYAGYVSTQLDGMVGKVKALQAAIAGGDVPAAQKAYADARHPYELVESDIEGFVLPGTAPTDNTGNLDYLIDMRASSLDPEVGWTGFHAIERDLFARGTITPTTRKYAVGLVKNVTTLAGIARKLTFKPEDLANGAAGLLEEVQSNKITGEEESFAHTDLADFADNVGGARQAFVALRPGLAKLDSSLVVTIDKRFAAVEALLKGYEDPAQVGGYVLWTPALRTKDAHHVSQTVQALADALSGLAEKVATA